MWLPEGFQSKFCWMLENPMVFLWNAGAFHAHWGCQEQTFALQWCQTNMKLLGQKSAQAHLSWMRQNWKSVGWQKKDTSSSRILEVTSCILYRSSGGWHDSYLQGHFLFLWAHVHSWGQQSPDTLWLGMLKGAIWCWYCCPGHQWLASGMVCLFLGQRK